MWFVCLFRLVDFVSENLIGFTDSWAQSSLAQEVRHATLTKIDSVIPLGEFAFTPRRRCMSDGA